MASEKLSSISLPPPTQPNRHASPPPSQIRQRGLGRAATFASDRIPLNRRRSSLFSEGRSETRKSFRSSTDDLLFPRANGSTLPLEQQESSHWHSFPLALALLPAVGGLFFQEGSAVVTDVTLLILAALFLNWAVRLPWEWYLSAQALRIEDPINLSSFESIPEETGRELDGEEAIASSGDTTPVAKPVQKLENSEPRVHPDVFAAQKELQLHELLALFACFLFPAIGAWLLHAIRSQLSRPSEGLVSDFNLMIFLLGSEVRPAMHLIKMIQARTLHLQRVVASSLAEDGKIDAGKVHDMEKRLEELEAHVADSVENTQKKIEGASDQVATKTVAQAMSDIRKGFQPELDALNRAVRRYEKRTTISAIQTETRLQDLESRLRDVVVLAAAAQRNAETQPRNFIFILVNWFCAAIVLPLQYTGYLLTVPSRATSWISTSLSRLLGFKGSKTPKDSKGGRSGTTIRFRERRTKVET